MNGALNSLENFPIENVLPSLVVDIGKIAMLFIVQSVDIQMRDKKHEFSNKKDITYW